MVEQKPIRPVVGVLYKEVEGEFLIMTQLRHVLDPSYDPLYDNTWEAIAETLNPGEDLFDGLWRGIEEECGVPVLRNSRPDTFTFSTGKGDLIISSFPLCMLQSVAEPQRWIGPAYPVKVPPDWKPDFSKGDGEATDARWWKPQELLDAIEKQPEQFMGLSAPALSHLAGKLLLDRAH